MDCKTTFSIGAGVFTDEDFERAAKEVLDPDINGWDFFVESRGTKIYRNYNEVGPGSVYKSIYMNPKAPRSRLSVTDCNTWRSLKALQKASA